MAQETDNPYAAILARRRAATAAGVPTLANPDPQPTGEEVNPYAEILKQRREEERRRMIAAQKLAAQTSPDRAAASMKLAGQTGLPADVVERNYDDVKTKWGGLPYQQIQLQTPSFSNWVAQPKNASLSVDDMPAMGNVEWVFKAPGRAFAQQLNHGRYAELAFKEFVLGQKLTTEERDKKNSYKFNAELGGDLYVGDSWFGTAVTGAGRLMAQAVDPIKYGAVGYALGYGLGGLVGGAIGSVAPGPGTVAGAVQGARLLGPVAAKVTMRAGQTYGVLKSIGQQEAVGAYEEMRTMHDEAGVPIDEGTARIAAMVVGGVNGAIEVANVDFVLDKWPALREAKLSLRRKMVTEMLKRPTVRAAFASLAKNYTGTLASNVGSEVVQRGVTILAEEAQKMAGGGKLELRGPEVWSKDLLDTAAASIPEFALGLTGGPAHQFARDLHSAQRAEQSVAYFSAIGEGVAQSKTATRHPEAFEELVKDAIKDNEGVKDVYVPLASWKTYWQTKDEDPGAMADRVTGRTASLADGEITGHLRIPMERYASQLAGTEHNAPLMMELRLGDPNAMNGRELEGFKEFVKLQQQATKAAEQTDEVKAKEADALQQVQDQLEAAGVPRGTAKVQSKVMQGVANLLMRGGMEPADAYRAAGQKLGRELHIRNRPLAEFLAEVAGDELLQTEPAPAEEEVLSDERHGQRGDDDAMARAEMGAAANVQASDMLRDAAAVTSVADTLREAGEFPDVGTVEEEIPGMAALEASLHPGSRMSIVEDDTGPQLNASGESAASAEAMNRLRSMQRAGKRFVVYDRAGRRRDLLGPDAVDYSPRPGETYGVEGADGFTLYTDNGGRVPTTGPRDENGPALQNALRTMFQTEESAILPGVQAGIRVEGEPGPKNAQGVSAHFVGYQPGYKDLMPTHALYNIIGGENDGSTVSADTLRKQGIPLPPTPPLITLYQQAVATSPRFSEWFGKSVVVDPKGKPLVVYHGTTRIFSSFARERANSEGSMGAGFYFTNDPHDVGVNYSGEGPDLRKRIEDESERIALDLQDLDPFLSDEEARTIAEKQAKQEHVEQGGMVIPVFLKMERPAVFGGPHETVLTFDEVYDEATGEADRTGTLVGFMQALREVAGNFEQLDIDTTVGMLLDAASVATEPITFTTLHRMIATLESSAYTEDGDGHYAFGELFRQAVEKMGYDGIIDHTAFDKWGAKPGRPGGMEGMTPETAHYVVFNPEQIKSAIGNNGNYDPLSANVLFQSAPQGLTLDTLQPAVAGFYTKLQRAVETAKQNQASGKDWKHIIKNLGVNMDEFAITFMDDLVDRKQYTKDEVRAHVALNRPLFNVKILGEKGEGPGFTSEELRERAGEIEDRMIDEYMQDHLDWDNIVGEAIVIEEEIEVEVEKEVEREEDTGEVDENGDPIYETVTVLETETEYQTVYYAGVRGGMKRVQRPGYGNGYRMVERERDEVIDDDDGPHDTERSAERAAERYVRDLRDEEWAWERAREESRESVDYDEAEEEARRELERENGGSQFKTQYESYRLQPPPEEDTYREGFLTNEVPIRKPEFEQNTKREVEQAVINLLYGDYFVSLDLTDEQKAEVAPRVAQAMEEQKAGLSRDMVMADLLKAYPYNGRALKDLDEHEQQQITKQTEEKLKLGSRDPAVLRQVYIDDNYATGRFYETFSPEVQAEIDRWVNDHLERRKNRKYSWRDGHGKYDHIKQPIVRVRWSVRLGSRGGKALHDQQRALRREMTELNTEINQLTQEYPIIRDRPEGIQQSIEAGRQKVDELRHQVNQITVEINELPPPERMFFVEEVQPPNKAEGNFAKMPKLFQDAWQQMAWRWILRMAVDQGFTRIAWTTGQQQIGIYPSIESLADSIGWTSDPNEAKGYYDTPIDPSRGEREVEVRVKGGGSLHFVISGKDSIVRRGSGSHMEDYQRKPLALTLGAEIVDRIVAAPTGVLQGPKLAVGGQGLKQLYDKSFPNEILKIPSVKKTGGTIEYVPMLSKADYVVEEVPLNEQVPTEAETAALRAKGWTEDRIEAALMKGQVREGIHVVKRFLTRDDAWTYNEEHGLDVRPQPSLAITDAMRELLGTTQDPFYQEHVYRPATAAERELLQAELDATLEAAAAPRGNPTQMQATIPATGEIYVQAQGRVDAKLLVGVLDFADKHGMPLSLDVRELDEARLPAVKAGLRRLGFVENGKGGTASPSAAGRWVRVPARARATRKQGGVKPKGAYQPYRRDAEGRTVQGRTISLFETANLSTFLHEAGHFYLDLFGEIVEELHGKVAAGATLSPSQATLLDDYNAILRHLGVQTKDQIGREQHELFARSFEAYLREGKAPDPELREAFGRFRAWLLNLYHSLTQLDAPLSDEIRGVFDRMLATDEAIAEAEALGRLQPMFLTADQAGISPERFAVYRKAIELASQSAREQLDKELIAEVERERTRQWQARKAEVRAQVTTETQAQPVYQAIAGITRGTLPDGTPLAEGQPAKPMKLSRAMIEENYGGKVRVKSLPRQFTTATADEAWDPQTVAELYGFASADAMLTELANAVPLQKQIAEETERRMQQEYGSIMLDGSIGERAEAAVADEQREIVLREELRVLAKLQAKDRAIVRDVQRDERKERDYERRWFAAEAKLKLAEQQQASREEITALKKEVQAAKAKARAMPAALRGAIPSFEAVRKQAKDLIARTLVSELRSEPYFAAARRASKAATEAAARQDLDTAITEKQKEIINLAFAREITRVKAEVETMVDQMRAQAKPTAMARLMIAGETYHDQVAGILDRFEFAAVSAKALARRAALALWVKGVESQGQTVTLPDLLLDETRRVNYKQLTVEELIGVVDGVKHIAHLAQFKNKLSKQQKVRSLNKLAAGLKASILSFKPTVKDVERDRRSGGERTRKIMAVLAAHRKLASLLREMDGWKDGGPMISAIMFPLNAAADNAAVMQQTATQEWNRLIEEAYPRGDKRHLYVKAHIPAVGISMSKMERLMVALNWGNEGNRDRLRNAEGWTNEQVQAILDTLDERDAKFVQGTLDFIGSYWEQIAGQSMRLQGVRPEKVEAKTFRIGTLELRGGYFPIKADDRKSAKAMSMLDLEAGNLAKLAAVAHPMTKHGHDQARAEHGDQPVRWDFGVISEHVTTVIHDLTHRETLIDVGKILGHKDVAQTIVDHYGDITYKTIKNTLRDIALGDTPAQNGFDVAFNHVRTGSTIVGLAWSLTTVAAQTMGFFTSVVRLRPYYMGRGLRAAIGTPSRMSATVEWVQEQSAFMRTRHLTQNREMNEIRNKVGIYSGKMSGWVDDVLATTTLDVVTRQGIADSYFYFIAKAQQMVDTPTWLGGYHKAIDQGFEHEQAVQIADQTVIDTQGHGSMKDLAEVQRGTPALKLFTNFYSAFSALYNQAVEVTKTTTSNPFDIGRLMVDYLLLFIFPAVLGYLLKQQITGDDDDDNKTWTEVIVRESLAYLMGTMVGLRELSGAVQGFYGYSGPAGSRIFGTASRLITQSSQLEADEAFFKALNETSGLLWHYPASRVWNGLKGLSALIEGKTKDPRALISGGPK